MGTLNESHQRHLLATFSRVDQLLHRIEQVVSGNPAPFGDVRADVPPDEARLLLAFVGVARDRMLAALDRLDIPRPAPAVSGQWSIEIALHFAEIALSELRVETLAGYGAVDHATAREVEALGVELRSAIRRGRALLHERDPGGLAERLAEIPGHVGEILRALERLSAEHGIAEVRTLLDAAADRAGATTLEVGVFGRVGAGKSSLINALVGASVLPVGATPVTAVPVRIKRGEVAGAIVRQDEGGIRAIPLEEIATYVTEPHNPHNQLGVRTVDITVPTGPYGIRFVDTPGVGSLNLSGPAQAFAWLPRCDLGLVLVQAGNPVGREEVSLVTGLTHAGIGCRLLVSKADALGGTEANEVLAYVGRELGSLGPRGERLEAHLVSARPSHSAWLEGFLREVLEPLARDRALVADVALRTRLHRLVAVSAAALGGNRLVSIDDNVSLARVRTQQGEEIARETAWVARAGPRLMKGAARAVVEAWSRGEHGSTVVRRMVLLFAADSLAATKAAVEAAQVGTPLSEERGARLPPLFDPDFLDHLPTLAPPRIGRRLLGPALAARALRPMAAPLTTALQRYADRLRTWGLARLDEVTAANWESAGSEPAHLPETLAHLDALIDQQEGAS